MSSCRRRRFRRGSAASRAFERAPNGVVGRLFESLGEQPRLGMSLGPNAKYFVGKPLAHALDARKIQHHLAKSFEPDEQAFGFGARDEAGTKGEQPDAHSSFGEC